MTRMGKMFNVHNDIYILPASDLNAQNEIPCFEINIQANWKAPEQQQHLCVQQWGEKELHRKPTATLAGCRR